MSDKRKALGRGLSALLPSTPTPPSKNRELFSCAIEQISPNPKNPRHTFDSVLLAELARSISVQGILQPLVVRPKDGDHASFELIAGERRFRAAQMAGLKEVPVIVKHVTPKEGMEIALVENLQRQDLNPLEEAEGYQELLQQYQYTQEQVAERVGKDRATVANAIRLLQLPTNVQTWVAEGTLTMGHARALLGLGSPLLTEQRAQEVIARGLSVRQTEALVRSAKAGKKAPAAGPSASVRDLEMRLTRSLGTAVRVRQKNNQRGQIEIDYTDLDHLDALLDRILTTK